MRKFAWAARYILHVTLARSLGEYVGKGLRYLSVNLGVQVFSDFRQELRSPTLCFQLFANLFSRRV